MNTLPMRVPSAKTPYAMVVGLDSYTGLQTARILADHKIPLLAIAKDLRHPCCRTRACKKVFGSDTAGEGLISTLEVVGAELNEKAVLFPCTDLSVLSVSRNRERLMDRYAVVLPEPKIVEMLIDKFNFYSFAQKEGLAIPRTIFLKNENDAEQAATQLTFPIILKPALRTDTWSHHANYKAFRVANAQELLHLYNRYSPYCEIMVAQEWIEGPDKNLYCCAAYFSTDSEPLVTFTGRKLRQWPPLTGSACLAEEVRDDVVLGETLRLLSSLNFVGLAHLEMKRDERTGKYYIIEPTIGRPTGRSSANAEAAGAEIIYTMYCDAIGWPLPANREQRYSGVKWIYLRWDIQSLLHYLLRGEITLVEWWQSWRGIKVCALFSWRDWGPFLSDIARTVGKVIRVKSRIKR